MQDHYLNFTERNMFSLIAGVQKSDTFLKSFCELQQFKLLGLIFTMHAVIPVFSLYAVLVDGWTSYTMLGVLLVTILDPFGNGNFGLFTGIISTDM